MSFRIIIIINAGTHYSIANILYNQSLYALLPLI